MTLVRRSQQREREGAALLMALSRWRMTEHWANMESWLSETRFTGARRPNSVVQRWQTWQDLRHHH